MGNKRRVRKGRRRAKMWNKEQRRWERKARIEKASAIDKKILSATLREARYSFCSNWRIVNLH